ncbi:hypothetical protein BCR41DRAFT_369737 [Lobosporangium transversale]|uniref:Uncharacterized protein n=1 Tax=Lobosporangium transversale TaxID=64571 RepID=A0A1Y2GRA4_9FUNG|nr:hypothetical protein BCR41DRAFT_369737 [Lobosporangium transversale]ORZ20064.1 hypothetical protein BCR41DRAFT_369737 [Lobosporangium transversale]|eukprot:XP_021882604.1 hypothetical protein BCR41DRAFT_369737 [Lobosporangium transversale]
MGVSYDGAVRRAALDDGHYDAPNSLDDAPRSNVDCDHSAKSGRVTKEDVEYDADIEGVVIGMAIFDSCDDAGQNNIELVMVGNADDNDVHEALMRDDDYYCRLHADSEPDLDSGLDKGPDGGAVIVVLPFTCDEDNGPGDRGLLKDEEALL